MMFTTGQLDIDCELHLCVILMAHTYLQYWIRGGGLPCHGMNGWTAERYFIVKWIANNNHYLLVASNADPAV